MALYSLRDESDIDAPALIAAFDGWVDAGAASTTAAGQLTENGTIVATFDADALFDYRARRPTLEIVDGRPAELTWPELFLRRASIGTQNLLVLAGPEPDYRWREFARDAVALARRFGVTQWISLGAIPAAVPHTRPVPIMGTASRPEFLRGGVQPGPEGVLRVPSAAISVLDLAVSEAGIPAVGYFAQVPHYVTGPYPAAAVELLRTIGRHFDVDVPLGALQEEATRLEARLNLAAASDDGTRAYVNQLEERVDESGLASGGDLISEIERFLRDRGGEGSQRS